MSDTTKRIIYKQDDGVAAIIVPAIFSKGREGMTTKVPKKNAIVYTPVLLKSRRLKMIILSILNTADVPNPANKLNIATLMISFLSFGVMNEVTSTLSK